MLRDLHFKVLVFVRFISDWLQQYCELNPLLWPDSTEEILQNTTYGKVATLKIQRNINCTEITCYSSTMTGRKLYFCNSSLGLCKEIGLSQATLSTNFVKKYQWISLSKCPNNVSSRNADNHHNFASKYVAKRLCYDLQKVIFQKLKAIEIKIQGDLECRSPTYQVNQICC